jgi:hypothetical protein
LSRVRFLLQKGTSRVKRNRRFRVRGDGRGVVSRAGLVLLRELGEDTGLVDAVTDALADTYGGGWVHAPGRVFCDLAAVLADGADCVSGIGVLADRGRLFGPVASTATAWRLLQRVDARHLPAVAAARAAARERAWAAGAAPDPNSELVIDVDATVTIAHSDKENAAGTWKHTFGFHPLLAFLDRPEIAGGEALAAILRPGNAGANTAADHIEILHQALAGLPDDDRADRPILVRTDSAGASKAFAAACRDVQVRFSLGFAVDDRVWTAVEMMPRRRWIRARNTDGTIRTDTWLAEITDAVDLSNWPAGSRLIARWEPLHPGAQTSFWNTTSDGYRITCFLTDTPTTGTSKLPGGLAALDLRHRRHARVEDRIRQAKATGLRNLPCHDFAANTAWLQLVLTAADLVCWTKLLAFGDDPALATAEIDTFRYRVFHAAAQLVSTARRLHLRIDANWPWARAITTAFARQRAAFGYT